jgi:hypothetical protein
MIKKYLNRLEQIDYLIRNKATGTPKEMAKKLGICERAWYKLRDELVNDLNLPIAYCSIQRSYYYTISGKFEVGFKYLTDDKKEKLQGGRSILRNYTSILSIFNFQ